MILFKTLPQTADDQTAIDTLARTIWGEAYAEAVRGKEAIAAVIVNRARHCRDRIGSGRWGVNVVETCLAPGQFPCWSDASLKR